MARYVTPLIASASALALASALGAAPALAERVGSVAAVNEEMRGTPPAAAQRPLTLGVEVVRDERVETGPVGSGQVLFLDQTALTVWPNSDVVLDRYVYNPETKTGEMALTMTRGLMRFIGGAISKEQDVLITTPHGVIGVRGGISMVEVGETFTRAVHVAGRYTTINGLTLARSGAAGQATEEEPGEAEYLGLLGSEALQESFTGSIGSGTGGLEQAPPPAQVNQLIASTGVAGGGSGAPGAAQAPRLSTFGEEEQAAESEAETVDVAVIPVDQQADAQRQIVEDGFVEPPEEQDDPVDDVVDDDPVDDDPVDDVVDDDPVDDDPVDDVVDDDPVDDDPVDDMVDDDPMDDPMDDPDLRRDDLVGVEFANFFGAQYTNFGADAAVGILIDNSFKNVEPFDFFIKVTEGDFAGSVYAEEADGGNGGFFTEDAGFGTDQPVTFDGVFASSYTIVSPDVFYLRAFSYPDNDPQGLRSLNFFGEPAPASLWTDPTDDSVTARAWELSPELFTNETAEFGPSLTDVFSDGEGYLFLIPEPNADAAIGSTFDGSRAKWGLGYLRIEGEGTSQITSLSVGTTRAERNDVDNPTALITPIVRTAARVDALDRGIYGDLPFAPLDGDGRTVFGPNADYIVLGQGGREVTQGEDADPQNVRTAWYAGEVYGGEVYEEYGDTRFASLYDYETLPLDERLRMTAPPQNTDFSNPLDGNFTGGYATTHAVSADNPLYILSNSDGRNVRFGFDPDTNTAVAEFEGLRDTTIGPGGAVTGLNLIFGNSGSRSAFWDREAFAIREPYNNGGRLTGMPLGADNRALSPDKTDETGEDYQTAFEGGLVTREIVGEGNLALPNPEPEYLSWGWWSGRVAYDEVEGQTYADEQLHLGAWVAGVRAEAGLVDGAGGVATYDGFAVANVVRQVGADRAAYVEGGSFRMTYDFDERFGSAVISGILGTEVGGTMTPGGASPGNHYGGLINGPVASGRLDGSFFTDANGDAIRATAGRFELERSDAIAVGIVAADGNVPIQ